MSDWITHEGDIMPVDGAVFVYVETVSPHFGFEFARPAVDYENLTIMGGNQWGSEGHPEARVARYRVA